MDALNWCKARKFPDPGSALLRASLLCATLVCLGGCVSDFVSDPGNGGKGGAVGVTLSFDQQPASTTSGQSLGPVRVIVRDSAGNVATGSSATITMSLASGTSGAQLAGTTTAGASHGVATFADLSVARAGTGYSLSASSPSLAPASSAQFDIAPGPTTSANVTPPSVTLNAVGAQQALTAQGQDANGNTTGATWTWASADPTIATVDAAGHVTAQHNGSTTIIASTGGVSASASVLVSQVATSIVVTPRGPDTLTSFGNSKSYTAQALDAQGNVIAGKTVTWASSATSVATMGANGTATAAGNGTTAIQASADGVTGSATLVVRQVVTSVAIDPSDFTLAALASQALAATAKDANGNTVTRSLSFTWQSSNSSEVTVTPNPTDGSRATASRSLPGTVTITVTTSGKSGTATAR